MEFKLTWIAGESQLEWITGITAVVGSCKKMNPQEWAGGAGQRQADDQKMNLRPLGELMKAGLDLDGGSGNEGRRIQS